MAILILPVVCDVLLTSFMNRVNNMLKLMAMKTYHELRLNDIGIVDQNACDETPIPLRGFHP